MLPVIPTFSKLHSEISKVLPTPLRPTEISWVLLTPIRPTEISWILLTPLILPGYLSYSLFLPSYQDNLGTPPSSRPTRSWVLPASSPFYRDILDSSYSSPSHQDIIGFPYSSPFYWDILGTPNSSCPTRIS